MRKLALLLLFVPALVAGPKSETYRGVILTTEEDFCGKSADYVLQASVTTEKQGTLVLVLAPKWFLLRLKLDVRIGDKVEVTALRQPDGTLQVLTLKSKGATYRLRDAGGRPLWKPEPGSEDLFKSICKA